MLETGDVTLELPVEVTFDEDRGVMLRMVVRTPGSGFLDIGPLLRAEDWEEALGQLIDNGYVSGQSKLLYPHTLGG